MRNQAKICLTADGEVMFSINMNKMVQVEKENHTHKKLNAVKKPRKLTDLPKSIAGFIPKRQLHTRKSVQPKSQSIVDKNPFDDEGSTYETEQGRGGVYKIVSSLEGLGRTVIKKQQKMKPQKRRVTDWYQCIRSLIMCLCENIFMQKIMWNRLLNVFKVAS